MTSNAPPAPRASPSRSPRASPASGARATTLRGVGLHTGAAVHVTLAADSGPIRIAQRGADGRIHEAALTELSVVGTQRATEVGALGGRLRVKTIEHAFAALAGLGVREGLRLVVDGPELPLLDGGAAVWFDALAALALPVGAPRLRVAREGSVRVERSRYDFQTGDGIEVACCFEVDDPRLTAEAEWLGAPDDFRARIAPARTFAFEHDLGEMMRGGIARQVDPAAVVLLSPGAVHCVAPFAADEPARHKLLDLIGDAYLHGGPPIGRLSAVRPGHAANARAFADALAMGILVAAG